MRNILWIVVTGLDGSGKTTLCQDLQKYFEENGRKVAFFHSPYDQYIQKELLNQSKDEYTDRLLFAIDNRLLGQKIEDIDKTGKDEDGNPVDIIISQRAWIDSMVHGQVQGFSYEQVNSLNRFYDLPKATVMLHLVAEYHTAFERIKNDPDADKFEYEEYMEKQEHFTRKAFYDVEKMEDKALKCFEGIKNYLIDTTSFSTDETFELALSKLKAAGIIKD